MKHLLASRDLLNQLPYLPKLGLIVFTGSDKLVPVCAGFLREVERGPYLFDGLISNPKLKTEQRAAGMALLWPAITALAGPNGLIGFTTDNQTYNRAVEAGFTVTAHTVLTLRGQS